MFEEMTDRIAGTLLTGLDVAVEFATLGEYRLVDPATYVSTEIPAPALPIARRPERRASGTVAPELLPKPATALGRASNPAPAPLKLRLDRAALRADREALGLDVLPRQDGQKRAVLPNAPRRRPGSPAKQASASGKRVRAGSVQAETQLCLFSR